MPETGQDSAAYERLRACVVGEADRVAPPGARAAGLGLVLQEGVAGWLKARADMTFKTEAGSAIQKARRVDAVQLAIDERTHSGAPAVAPEILPLAQQSDLTLLIASMVVSTQRPRLALPTGAFVARTRFQDGVACR